MRMHCVPVKSIVFSYSWVIVFQIFCSKESLNNLYTLKHKLFYKLIALKELIIWSNRKEKLEELFLKLQRPSENKNALSQLGT